MSRYGHSWSPGYIDHLQKQFMTAPIEDIKDKMEKLPQELKTNQKLWDLQHTQARYELQKQNAALQTKENTYYRADATYYRIVCSDHSPEFEKNGMVAYEDNLTAYDPELNGYYGIHVGDPEEWLPVLARDGYCDGDAYIYAIKAGSVENSPTPFYVMEDYNVMDRHASPDSEIIFSRNQMIPASLIELVSVIPYDNIEPADDLY